MSKNLIHETTPPSQSTSADRHQLHDKSLEQSKDYLMKYYDRSINDLRDLLKQFRIPVEKVNYWLSIDPQDWSHDQIPSDELLNEWNEILIVLKELQRRPEKIDIPEEFSSEGEYREDNYQEVVRRVRSI